MPKYSGPALAAGAISQAIGDMFEGLLAGQRGGLAAESEIGKRGALQHEQLLKASAFPVEAALARAQTALARAQVPKLSAEAERIYRMTPEEIGQMRAETGRAGAQTDLLGVQARKQELENKLEENAIEHWNQLRAQAQAQNRELNSADIWNFTRQHPVLLRGAQNIPASALMDMNEMEMYLKLLAAKQQDPYKGPQFMLNVQKQAEDEAEAFVKRAAEEGSFRGGWFSKGDPGMVAGDVKQWLSTANRNRILVESGLPDVQSYLRKPGAAPKAISEYVLGRLEQDHSGTDRTMLLSWANEIIARWAMGDPTWQAAFEGLRRMTAPAPKAPVNAPGATPERSGGAPATPQSYRYNPATGEMR